MQNIPEIWSTDGSVFNGICRFSQPPTSATRKPAAWSPNQGGIEARALYLAISNPGVRVEGPGSRVQGRGSRDLSRFRFLETSRWIHGPFLDGTL